MKKIRKPGIGSSRVPINQAQQGRKMPGALPRKSGPASGAAYKGRSLDKPKRAGRRWMEDIEV